MVEQILGPDILVWGTLILSKPANSGSFVSWHQDNAYGGFLNGRPALSAWIAVTPAKSENGCMRVIPKSQGPALPFSKEKPIDDMLSRGLRITSRFDESDAVDLELRPGEASLHDVGLIHGSGANAAAYPRTGFIVRYTTPGILEPGFPVYRVKGDAAQCEMEPAWMTPGQSMKAYLDYLEHERFADNGKN